MSVFCKSAMAVAVAALLLGGGTFAVRAQDAAPEIPPAEAPATEAPAAEEAPAGEAPATEAPAAEAPAEEAPAEMAAEPARNPDDIVARFGDNTVTEREITVAAVQFAEELAQVPEADRRNVLIDAVVSVKLMAQAARDEGLDQSEDFKALLAFQADQALRNAYIEQNIVPSLTDAEMQQGYQDMVVSQHQPQEEVHARHILVATEEEATAIIEQLKTGAAFEELATQSLDQTGQSGGDLGFFGRGQMVPPFEEAAFALEPGSFTQEPVQSEFGWHVIQVEEKRMSEPQAFAEVEQQLREFLMRQKFETALNDLRQQYPVEIIGAPAPEAPAASEDATTAPDGAAETETPDAAVTPEEPAAEPAN